jgi:hypothetical protein
MRALHLRVGPEDQFFEVLVTAMAMELKNGHYLDISLITFIERLPKVLSFPLSLWERG